MDQSNILSFGKDLTLSQMTNFRLFQIESVADNNFKFDENGKSVLQMGRKHCGKRRNCSL